MNNELAIKTVSGIVQYFGNESEALEYYNRNGRIYELRGGENGRELWHKGHNRLVGVIETIPARS